MIVWRWWYSASLTYYYYAPVSSYCIFTCSVCVVTSYVCVGDWQFDIDDILRVAEQRSVEELKNSATDQLLSQFKVSHVYSTFSYRLFYTRVHKKGATLFRTITLTFLGEFLQFFYQWKQEWTLCGWVTKFTTYFSQQTVSVSPHYLLKLKPHKQRILKSVVTVFHYSTEEWVSVWDKWAVFL